MAQEKKDSSEQLPVAIIDIRDQYTRSIIINSLKNIVPQFLHYTPSSAPSFLDVPILYWLEYEDIDFSQIFSNTNPLLVNSYCIRKGLIRKAQMNFIIQKHVAKYPNSCLKKSTPETWFFEIDHVDYFDEALDEIFEVVQECKKNVSRERMLNFILKPNLGNKGADLKIFHTIDQLRSVFDVTHEEKSVNIDENLLQLDDVDESIFHLREWVIQRYISNPLLINDRKFHIRAYVLAVSKIKVYLYKDMLALFALHPYRSDDINDTLAHLTNTCLQIHDESFKESDQVKLFWELMHHNSVIDEQDLISIFEQIKNILVDANKDVYLLEANSFPDFKQTGDRLSHMKQIQNFA